jgi:phosphopantetheinyl transferase (holo-ACP synthase)
MACPVLERPGTDVNGQESTDIWLASPEAADYFRPHALSSSEAERYAGTRSTQRRLDFAVSRALRQQVGNGLMQSGLSHSGGYAAVARIGVPAQVGIDLELHKPRDILSIARFAYAAREVAALQDLPGTERLCAFYSLWTLKEAFAKALQLPLLDALKNCVFLRERSVLRGELPTKLVWKAYLFAPRKDLSLAMAVVGSKTSPRLRMYEWPPVTTADWPQPFEIEF